MKTFTTKTLLLAFSFFTLSSSLLAQNVAINTHGSIPDPSAILDVSDTTRGMLIPRMTTRQMNAISSPATSLFIYNTTTNCFMFYTGSSWMNIVCTCTGAPSAPGTITGNDSVCSGASGITYSIAPVSGAISYTWNVPSGATITAGQGATSITVMFGNFSGNVSVTATNSCGTSAASIFVVTVLATPAAPGTISGPASPSINSTGNVYSIAAVNQVTGYLWTITPAGNTITAGQGTTSITLSMGSSPATYSICVYDSNACGKSSAGPCLSITSISCSHGSSTFSYSGSLQTWTVPSCITTITITAYGASGGNSVGSSCGGAYGAPGLGAQITGTFTVGGGNVLDLLVGQEGQYVSSSNCDAGSGGGGTYIWNTASSTNPLVVAGGGGGGSDGDAVAGGGSATQTTTAVHCAAGGSGGNGGTGGNCTSPIGGGAGAGWLSDGGNGSGTGNGTTPGGGGIDPSNGGAGGAAGNPGATGGYGGGGGCAGNCGAGGGGGGYNGGGGGMCGGNGNWGSGGGGGSYNGGTNQTNTGSAWTGNGQVIITW